MHLAGISDRRALLLELRGDIATGVHTRSLMLTTIAGAMLYGLALGSWHGPTLAVYAAVKVPALLIGTAALTALFNWIVASILGLSLGIRQTFAIALVPLCISAVVAASLAPPLFFFAAALPPPTPAQQTLHNVFYLLHVAVLATAGLFGTSVLRGMLLDLCDGRIGLANNVQFVWIVTYAFVAGELAWALRPFVGSVHLPVVFLRPDALEGNVYEFILRDIVPHLWRRIFG